MLLKALEDFSPLSLIGAVLPRHRSGRIFWSASGMEAAVMVPYMPVEGDLKDAESVVGACSVNLEMYGGAGLGGNAGGVRCANIGGLQIKGVGSTILAGLDTDKWHRHGALSLQDAIRETVMGELIHLASPYGAVRSVGIVGLGFSFATEVGVDKFPSSAPRALLYRELCVRAAHFMRSSFMNVGPELACRELDRMRDGIPRLVDWLCRDLGGVSFDSAAQGLLLMIERLMNQVAVLRTKRLVHGSLIPSNFCIDGRLLDFTTSTAVSTLHPVMVSLGGVTSQQQHSQILQAVPDLLFYITKYDSRCKVSIQRCGEVTKSLMARLDVSHHGYLMREHLCLFGFSLASVMGLPLEVRENLIGALLGAIGCGSTEGQLYFGGDEHPMLPQTGRDDLFALLAGAIQITCGLRWPCDDSYRPTPDVFPPRVVHLFNNAFSSAAALIPSDDLSIVEQGFAWLIRGMQRHADLTPLYRRYLDGAIHSVCMQGGDVGEFVRQTLASWAGVFTCPADGMVSLQGWLTDDEVLLLPSGYLRIGDQVCSPLRLSRFSAAVGLRPRHRWLYEVASMNASASMTHQ